jgi:hypothetical protein
MFGATNRLSATKAAIDPIADVPSPLTPSRKLPLSVGPTVGIEEGERAAALIWQLHADLRLNTSHEPIQGYESPLVPTFADETVTVAARHVKAEGLSLLFRKLYVRGDAASNWRG